MVSRKIIITLDGTAASGKGTLAEKLAEHFGFYHLDTGLVYRAVGYSILRNSIEVSDTEKVVEQIKYVDLSDLSNPILLSEEVGSYASKIGVIQEVRDCLNSYFRAHILKVGSAVIDGRDIGTVVFPDADIKIYVTAKVEIRADRRFKQLQNAGKSIIYEDVLEDLKIRDERDSSRKVAPLKPASDAIYIDTSDLDASSVLNLAVSLSSALVTKNAA